jgi:hypothetical protein
MYLGLFCDSVKELEPRNSCFLPPLSNSAARPQSSDVLPWLSTASFTTDHSHRQARFTSRTQDSCFSSDLTILCLICFASSPQLINVEIPWGSVFGPLLFVSFAHCFGNLIQSHGFKHYLPSEDLKVVSSVHTIPPSSRPFISVFLRSPVRHCYGLSVSNFPCKKPKLMIKSTNLIYL